jgi:hypothetical protein
LKIVQLVSLVLILSYSEQSFALKKCPQTGSKLLDQTYPTNTFITALTTPDQKELIKNFVLAYKTSPDQIPGIEISAPQESYDDFIAELNETLKSKGLDPDKYTAQLRHSKIPPYTWQQDLYLGTFDKVDGKPVVNLFDGYKSKLSDEYMNKNASTQQSLMMMLGGPVDTNLVNKSNEESDKFMKEILDATEKMTGKPTVQLSNLDLKYVNAGMGGNIQALPGGLCLIGDAVTDKYAAQFCGDNKDDIVKVDTSWMEVGHVDELIKVLPSQKPCLGEDCSCQFSLVVGSPNLALEQLGSLEGKNSLFLNTGDGPSSPEERFNVMKELLSCPGTKCSGQFMCEFYISKVHPLRKFDNKSDENKESNGARYSKMFLDNFLISPVFAGITPIRIKTSCKNSYTETNYSVYKSSSACTDIDFCAHHMQSLTNKEFLDAIKSDPDYQKYLDTIQKNISQSEEKMKSAIKTKLPHCDGKFDVAHVPQLFYPTDGYDNLYVEIDGVTELKKPGSSVSLFPNPSNGVLANKTYIVPQQINSTFDKATSKIIKESTGLEVVSSPSMNLHKIFGNLHCASKSILECKP